MLRCEDRTLRLRVEQQTELSEIAAASPGWAAFSFSSAYAIESSRSTSPVAVLLSRCLSGSASGHESTVNLLCFEPSTQSPEVDRLVWPLDDLFSCRGETHHVIR